MADQSKLCTITNNSGQDAVVTLTVANGETNSQDAIISLDQQTEILKTSSGNTIIRNGSSDTVTLDHNYKPPAEQTGYVQNYDLVISDSNWLCPLAPLRVVQQGTNGVAAYATQTVGATDRAAMSEAFDFYQTLIAYPDSELTKDYIVAETRGDNAIDSFFKGTSQYKDVTLGAMVTVGKYYNNFPCVWAHYKDSITYYLYGREVTIPIFVGALFLNKSGAVDITKPNCGYTCLFAPAGNFVDLSKTDVDVSKMVNLTYIGGAFFDDINTSQPKIELKGNFQLKRVLTNKPDDIAIIPVFTGTVNGILCTGIDVPIYEY